MRKAIVVAVVLAGTVTPAFADPSCLSSGGSSFRVQTGFSVGEFTEQDQMDFDLMRARRAGINAETAERTWLGCLKITRRGPNGWITEYYDPDSFEQKPLDLRLPG